MLGFSDRFSFLFRAVEVVYSTRTSPVDLFLGMAAEAAGAEGEGLVKLEPKAVITGEENEDDVYVRCVGRFRSVRGGSFPVVRFLSER